MIVVVVDVEKVNVVVGLIVAYVLFVLVENVVVVADSVVAVVVVAFFC